MQNGDPFFYQQLLFTKPWRSETELLGQYSTYREHFLDLHPNFRLALENNTNVTAEQHRLTLQDQFNTVVSNLLETLASTVTQSLASIITAQLDALKILPPTVSQTAMLDLPHEQYKIMNIITNNLGPVNKKNTLISSLQDLLALANPT